MELRDPPPVRTAEGKATKPDQKATDPRHVTRVAHAVLHAVAQSEAKLGTEERRILDRYSRALGLRAPTTSGVTEAPPEVRPRKTRPATAPDAPEAPPHKMDLASMPVEVRLHVLRLMFRTAYANGRCSQLDLAVLRRIADAMDLTGDQFADSHASVEEEQRRRKRGRLTMAALAALAVVAFAVIVPVIWNRILPGDETELFERIDQVILERARRDAETIRSTSARLEQLELRIAEFIDEREQATTTTSATTTPAGSPSGNEIREEIRALKNALERLKSEPDVFKRLESRYHESVLLIMVAFDLVSGGNRRKLTGYGTGFFVTPTGLILTNKHVIEPWKFEAEVAELLDQGYRLDESSIRMAAWPTGARVWQAPGEAILGNAFNSSQGTLRLVAAPPDELERTQAQRPDGTIYTGKLHLQNNADLAVLQAAVGTPVVPLPLATDPSTIEKLDPVMVLGFPSGPAMLESDKAETSPSLGTVRKVEDTVQVSAPIVQGNSGGPVIDLDGKVIGIATRTAFGEASLGVCIQSRHALDLLPTARELLGDAARLIDGGHGEVARPLVDLAALRNPEDGDVVRIERLRGQLTDLADSLE